MALNDEERKTMVSLEIEKADRFLKQAGMMTTIINKESPANITVWWGFFLC